MTAGTVITGIALLAIAAAAVVKLARDTRKGRCAGCGRGERGCPGASARYTKK